ncbi:hypothetical protein CPB84DRAFT_1745975 [Gymnopilus junonius]|uniref:Uncharacterized protein n=1 Tax=Gymnopilus junonius TaxID=109634 RepID=A0A9P5TNR8_GYMJU|nr:hypothetical protein CPB84DRAFT_1745975 [Gymnopilus junonius]
MDTSLPPLSCSTRWRLFLIWLPPPQLRLISLLHIRAEVLSLAKYLKLPPSFDYLMQLQEELEFIKHAGEVVDQANVSTHIANKRRHFDKHLLFGIPLLTTLVFSQSMAPAPFKQKAWIMLLSIPSFGPTHDNDQDFFCAILIFPHDYILKYFVKLLLLQMCGHGVLSSRLLYGIAHELWLSYAHHHTLDIMIRQSASPSKEEIKVMLEHLRLLGQLLHRWSTIKFQFRDASNGHMWKSLNVIKSLEEHY